jgi:hypothetical protein|nr:MAG TPA: baseplate wedge protein [Caudoviricetes sp.]
MISETSEAFGTSNQFIKYTITVTENSYSVENNSSNVTVSINFYRTNTGYTTYGNGTVYCFIYNDTYSQTVTPSDAITNSGIDLFTRTVDIPHNDDGTRNLNVAAYISHERVTSESHDFYVDLTTIPRASELTCPTTWNLGDELSFTIDRKSSSFRDTLSYHCTYTENGVPKAYSGDILTKSSATSAKFTPPFDWAKHSPNVIRGMASFTLSTYDSSGTLIGSTVKNSWFTIPDTVIPDCSISLSDTSSIWVSGSKKSCLEYFGKYVSGVSTIYAEITASGAYGSTIKSYSGSYPGGSFSTRSFNISTNGLSGACQIDATVRDSRNRKNSASVSARIAAYSPPKVTALSVRRCKSKTDSTEDEQGNYTQVTYGYKIVNVAKTNKNAKSIVLKYKTTSGSESEWITQNLTASAYSGTGSIILETSSDNSYVFSFTVSDSISSSSKSTSVSTGYCIYHVPASGKGITFGGIAEGDGFNVKMPATFSSTINASGNFVGQYVTGTWLQTVSATDLGRKPPKVAVIDESGWIYSRALSALILEAVYPVGSIYISVNSTSPKTLFGGTWKAIKGKFLLGQSSAHTAGSTGGEETHTLTMGEMPEHTHPMYSGNAGGDSNWTPDEGAYLVDSVTQTKTTWWARLGMSYAGGGNAHNNMPPYLAVYMWKRTA